MKNKMKWYDWLICGCCLAVATLCIILNCLYVKQGDKIEELEKQIGVMYRIEDADVFAVDYENEICYVWYGDQMLRLEIVDRILHTDIRQGDIAYFMSNYDLTDAVLIAIQHYDD